MESLSEIFNRIGHFGSDVGHNDKGSTHSYIESYEKLLTPFREKCDFMEIGIASGKSMEMWGDYFGRECSITGVDLSIVFDTNGFDERFRFIACDATSQKISDELGTSMFDVIVDDGSHMGADQERTFLLLSGRVRPGGLYIIEDILSLEAALPSLCALHSSCEVIDLRGVKGRFDDVLVVYRL